MSARGLSVALSVAAAVLTSLSVPTLSGDDTDNGGGTRRFGAASGNNAGRSQRRIGNFKGGHLGASSFGDGSAPGQDAGGVNVISPGAGGPQNGGQPEGGGRRPANDPDRSPDDESPRFSRRVGNTDLRQWEVGAGLPTDSSYAYWANWGTNAGLLMKFGWGFPFLGMGTGMPGMPAMPGPMSPNADSGNVYGPSLGYGYGDAGVGYGPSSAQSTNGEYTNEPSGTDGAPSERATNSNANPTGTTSPRSNSTDPKSVAPPPRPQPQSSLKTGSDATENARINAEKGENLFRSGDYKGAVYCLKHALTNDPRNGVLMMLLAQSMFAAGQYNDAATTTQAAVRLLPEDQWGVVITNRKELYQNPVDYLDQLWALDKFVKEKPNDPALRFLAGFHYAYLGYPKAAVDHLDKGLKLAPQDLLALQIRDEMQALLAPSNAPPIPQPPAEDDPASSKSQSQVGTP